MDGWFLAWLVRFGGAVCGAALLLVLPTIVCTKRMDEEMDELRDLFWAGRYAESGFRELVDWIYDL